jgi:hypothetical protein
MNLFLNNNNNNINKNSIYNTQVKAYVNHEPSSASSSSVVSIDATKRNKDDRLSKLMNEFNISSSSNSSSSRKKTVDPYEDDHDNKSYIYSRKHQFDKSNKHTSSNISSSSSSKKNNYREFNNDNDDDDDDDDIITMMDRYK